MKETKMVQVCLCCLLLLGNSFVKCYMCVVVVALVSVIYFYLSIHKKAHLASGGRKPCIMMLCWNMSISCIKSKSFFVIKQKLMIDEKKCYFFGRNKQMCDFNIDHQSCSRVHAALVWHKHLNRPFLIDLGSSKLRHCSQPL